jgi:hypothetical protein
MKTPLKERSRHGLNRAMARINVQGLAAIDGRSAASRALIAWRSELEHDLGGTDALSSQEKTLVELCCRDRLLLDSIDGWLLTQPSLVNKRRKALLPVIAQRQQLADALARHLGALGLKRRLKQAPSLEDYLASKEARKESDEATNADDPASN